MLYLRNAAQISSPINLVSGEFYFMQAIIKAGSNPFDHLRVGVRQPNGKTYQPILNPDLYNEIPGVNLVFSCKFVCLCGEITKTILMYLINGLFSFPRPRSCSPASRITDPGRFRFERSFCAEFIPLKSGWPPIENEHSAHPQQIGTGRGAGQKDRGSGDENDG